ncbi:MAG TPA: 3' terminal RNA ribose 2'-O-methyltransferase Hen1 [Abditibacteriaceae bacterium]|jgi:3' terminal RNA ribose 2'-O-methyltransferase Hen1
MLLTITTTHTPATDLGYLLHKNPARLQTFDMAFGRVHVFYPEATKQRCTAALLLDIDPIGLVRGRRGPGGDNRVLEHYVNDRPYVASSFLSVALAHVYRDAMAARSKERPDLAGEKLPLHAHMTNVPSRGGEAFLRRLFEPLGYEVAVQSRALDEKFPQWGQSPHCTIDLRAQTRLADLLNHLYVLIPVLDDEKHYWVGEDEVEKLLRRGEGWLQSHPEREAIINRYLRRQRHLTRSAVEQLTRDEAVDVDEVEAAQDAEEEAVEKPLSLHEQRLHSVHHILKESGARRVLDLGCGEGRLLRLLLKDWQFEEIVGVDVSHRSLDIVRERLERVPLLQKARIKLLQGALTYRDQRLNGYDAAAIVEVIEHLEPARLTAFARVVFEFARPATVVLTTPNAEYNVKWETLPAGTLRHKDHRFEWTRHEFETWAQEVAARFGYAVRFAPVGPEDEVVGAPTQMAVFTLSSGGEKSDSETADNTVGTVTAVCEEVPAAL